MPDVDYSKSTRLYPTPPTPKMVAGAADDTEWTASTMAYPMAAPTAMRIVDSVYDSDGHPVDFTRSTGAYPMVAVPTVQKENADGSAKRA